MTRITKAAVRMKLKTASVPSPIGGLNAVSSLADMPPTDALVMDNWFPQPSRVSIRNGCAGWAWLPLSESIESLMAFSSGARHNLFAASRNGNIYDVTDGGHSPVLSLSGLSSGRFQHVNFGTPAGQFLVILNGLDPVRVWNGSAWSAPAITGVDSSRLLAAASFKNRLFFVEKDSLKAWYLPVSQIGGAAQPFDFSGFCTLGGSLQAVASFTSTAGYTVEDYLAFITSEGEVLLYQGTDPTDSALWSLVGRFLIGRPVGLRCHEKVGANSIVITADGFSDMSGLLNTGREAQNTINKKIVQLVNNDVALHKEKFGWQPILYPIGNKLIINVPASPPYQYVMNTITGAWCRFTGWNAVVFETTRDRLYYAFGSRVFIADVADSDDGQVIVGDIKTPYNYFGTRGRLKRWTMARLLIETNACPPALSLIVSTDFKDDPPPLYGSASLWDHAVWDVSPWDLDERLGYGSQPLDESCAVAIWDVSHWDVALWDVPVARYSLWQAVRGVGYNSSIRLRTKQKYSKLHWYAVDYMMEPGGVL